MKIGYSVLALGFMAFLGCSPQTYRECEQVNPTSLKQAFDCGNKIILERCAPRDNSERNVACVRSEYDLMESAIYGSLDERLERGDLPRSRH